MSQTNLLVDRSAIAVSTLCLIHCLLLPILVTGLPFLGILADAEWLHQTLVFAVVPLALIAFLPPLKTRYKYVMRAATIGGISVLIGGAFVEALHDYETQLTFIGALLIGTAYSYRILYRWHEHVALK